MSSAFRTTDVHGRRLRYICEGDGPVTVVIDQGQGLSIEQGFERPEPMGWTKVFKEIQNSTRVLMHDRAGLGSSDPAPGRRTSSEMVDDLRAVLAAAQVRPPYVLVGHSVGGFNVRLFAGRYPNEVPGLVLVDSCHPDQLGKFASILPPEAPGEAMPLKLLRRGPGAALSAEAIDFRACAEQARGVMTIGRKPLVVVSQSPHALGPPGIPLPIWEKMRIVWSDLQGDLLRLSAKSTQVIATHAGHLIQFEEPGLVANAILGVVRDAQIDPGRMH
ncbi:MAG TPA: alpha/beta hydrolase [Steroidobacteraceae bacterium]|nr:alpha/beta hydrolase [Steroidobacteraceae bacterium]